MSWAEIKKDDVTLITNTTIFYQDGGITETMTSDWR